MKILNDNTDKHVQDKETDEKQEGDEKQESPLVMVFNGLKSHLKLSVEFHQLAFYRMVKAVLKMDT